MKRFIALLCVFVLLVAATGAVSAAKPAPKQFTIRGYTTFFDYPGTLLPNGHTRFHVIARGGGNDADYNAICKQLYSSSCQAICRAFPGKVCGASGYFTGAFNFDEWIEVDMNSGKGENNGIVTLTDGDDPVLVRFEGITDSVSVWGKFKVEQKEGTGAYTHLEGRGNYTGNAGLVFSVTFTEN